MKVTFANRGYELRRQPPLGHLDLAQETGACLWLQTQALTTPDCGARMQILYPSTPFPTHLRCGRCASAGLLTAGGLVSGSVSFPQASCKNPANGLSHFPHQSIKHLAFSPRGSCPAAAKSTT